MGTILRDGTSGILKAVKHVADCLRTDSVNRSARNNLRSASAMTSVNQKNPGTLPRSRTTSWAAHPDPSGPPRLRVLTRALADRTRHGGHRPVK